MLDATIQSVISRPVDAAGRALAATGISANAITLLGATLAMPLVYAVAAGHSITALLLLAINRALDGLDGAIARATHPSALGGYFDIVADYLFYAGVPFGFALAAPSTNALPAAALLGSFLLTCSSFLAYAALAARRLGGEDVVQPRDIALDDGQASGDDVASLVPGKNRVVRHRGLADALGVRAFLFTLKLERCSTRADLAALLPDYEKAIRKFRGEAETKLLVERANELRS